MLSSHILYQFINSERICEYLKMREDVGCSFTDLLRILYLPNYEKNESLVGKLHKILDYSET